jgi:hypothetical protein
MFLACAECGTAQQLNPLADLPERQHTEMKLDVVHRAGPGANMLIAAAADLRHNVRVKQKAQSSMSRACRMRKRSIFDTSVEVAASSSAETCGWSSVPEEALQTREHLVVPGL